MTTLEKIKNEGYDGEKLKLDSAEFVEKDNSCVLSFVYNASANLSSAQKASIKSMVESDIGEVCSVKVKFNKYCFDEDVIRNLIDNYFELYYKALSLIFTNNDINISKEEDRVWITLQCDEMTKQVLENKGFESKLTEFLNQKSFENFCVKLVAKMSEFNELPNEPTFDDSLEKCLAEEEKLNIYDVEVKELLVGKQTSNTQVIFIKDIPNKNGEEVLLAGKIEGVHKSTFIKKSKKQDGEIQKEKTKISFSLVDLTGKMDVVWFKNDDIQDQEECIKEGNEYAILGVVSSFKDNINIKLSGIYDCEIRTRELKKIYREVNSEYKYIFPQPVTEVKQMDLFSLSNATSDFWQTHDEVVVFDFETTGLNAKTCNIIEIGAVKIKKGSIIETFQTLVNPHEEIPEEISNITHITNDMVVDAPSLEQVLPDFYKFTYGAVLSAYNIDFDYQFLSLGGEKLRLLFDNEQIDTLKLARDKVPSLSNYKLGTVVKALDITLNNAHRALADAYATAKVFVKLI